MNHIISNILRKPMLITMDSFLGYSGMVHRFLNGKLGQMDISMLEQERSKNAGYVINGNSRFLMDEMAQAPKGSTLVMPLKGAIMKESYCGDKGTAEVMQILMKADATDSIEKVVLHIDSGGGSVDGTFELADYIKNSFSKPITAFVDGMAASAAYAIACACDEVVASHETAEVGSIGVCISITDYSAMMESRGIKEHYINATKSKDKNRAYNEALAGNYDMIREEGLDPVLEIFVNTVKANRKDVAASVFTGKMYLAGDAMRLGLIDGIGSLDMLVNGGNTNRNNFMGNDLKAVTGLKGLGADEITNEQLGAANRALIEAGIEGVELVGTGDMDKAVRLAVSDATAAMMVEHTQTVEALQLQLDEAVTANNACQDTILELQAEVARLGKLLPEGSTTVVKTTADVTEEQVMSAHYGFDKGV